MYDAVDKSVAENTHLSRKFGKLKFGVNKITIGVFFSEKVASNIYLDGNNLNGVVSRI